MPGSFSIIARGASPPVLIWRAIFAAQPHAKMTNPSFCDFLRPFGAIAGRQLVRRRYRRWMSGEFRGSHRHSRWLVDDGPLGSLFADFVIGWRIH